MKLIITHKNTIEGFTAGWVASRLLGEYHEKDNPRGVAKWLQVEEGSPLPKVKDFDVLMLGVVYSRGVVKRLMKEASSLMIFDNSFESRAEVGGMKNVKIDLDKTVARMAWNHIRGMMKIVHNKEVYHITRAPWIVDYSDDKKLWPWENVKPYFIRLAIAERYKPTLESWDELCLKDVMIVESEGLAIAQEKHKQEAEEEKLARQAAGEAVTTEEKTEGEKNGSGGPAKSNTKRGNGKGGSRKPGKPAVSKAAAGKAE